MGAILDSITDFHKDFTGSLPYSFGDFFNLMLIVLLVSIYAVFIWKFYRFIATKNILGLNLSQYNKTEHPFFSKFFAMILYLVEYILIMPFLIFFWFAVFAFFLVLITNDMGLEIVLLISATIVAAVRMTSYYNEDLSKDLAKLLPFTILAISLLNPHSFNLERTVSYFSQIPAFFGKILIYMLFIILLEIILRFFDFTLSLFGIGDEYAPEEKK